MNIMLFNVYEIQNLNINIYQKGKLKNSLNKRNIRKKTQLEQV